MVVRLRPTLPHRHQCSTIGAEGLSFRVRNGAGRFPFAMTAETLWRYQISGWCSRLYLGNCTVDAEHLCKSSYRLISTGQLHTLLCFHIRPINPVVWLGASRPRGPGNLILKRASRLDAFSGYHFRT